MCQLYVVTCSLIDNYWFSFKINDFETLLVFLATVVYWVWEFGGNVGTSVCVIRRGMDKRKSKILKIFFGSAWNLLGLFAKSLRSSQSLIVDTSSDKRDIVRTSIVIGSSGLILDWKIGIVSRKQLLEMLKFVNLNLWWNINCQFSLFFQLFFTLIAYFSSTF